MSMTTAPEPTTSPASGPAIPECPECPGEPLSLLQSDEAQPFRLLGSCAGCGRVYFVEPVNKEDDWPDEARWKIVGTAGRAAV